MVFFSIIQQDDGAYDIEFNFENESLKHRVGNTMRENMFEVSKFEILLVTAVALD